MTAATEGSLPGRVVFIGVLLWIAASRATAASDWPQWRFDASRSGATDEAGPDEPSLLWRHRLDHPDPAYDHQYRMCGDVTYAPIAAEGLLFLPSNVTDQVMACELETGAVRWRFITEGPVRFAPVYCRGKVYFGSDDGYLYCVSAAEGRLVWKVRGVPETLPDSRMLAGGRLASRWPARGAPVEHEGVIYFGAGIWPEEGVYVSAVSADSGRVLWQSDRMSYVKNGMSDHGRAYDLGLPPQGYLAIIDGKLAVPSGRSLAAWFDPATGKMEPYTCFYVKNNPPRGTWYLAGIDEYSVQGGNWFGTRAEALPPVPADLKDAKPAVFWSRETPENESYVIQRRPFLRADTYGLHDENLYTEPVLTETTIYASEFADEAKYLVPRGHTHISFPDFDRIVARDLTGPRWTSTVLVHYAYGRKKVKTLRLEFPVLWELACPLRVLIKAADRLYAGDKDAVAAIAIPRQGEKPRIAWQQPVDGTPVHALVADRKLVVVTAEGHVFCFGAGGTQPAGTKSTNGSARPLAAGARPAQVPGLNGLRTNGSPLSGYACLLGWGDGARAKALARDDGYRVIVFEPDPAKAAQARTDLATAGMYGRQVQVIEAQPDKMLFAPYWANLVEAESIEAIGSPEATLSAALDLLRPYSGKLLLPDGGRYAGLIERLLADRTGYAMKLDGATITVHRQSPPDGFDDWTHEAGGPANCFANSERLVKWPLGVLWYSGDVDRYFTPAEHFQHERQPYPLVVDGRMFLITGQLLHAIDIYTGSYLWKAEMPLTPWVQTRFFDSRIYGRPTERNCAAASDWVYAVTGEKIYAYDAATGRQVKVFDVPPPFQDQAQTAATRPQEQRYMGTLATVQASPQWTEVRLWNDLLMAVLGRTLVAVDRHSGEVCWSRPSTRQTTTYALGGDTLFGLDCDVPPMGGGAKGGELTGLLFALDPKTGQLAWQKQAEYDPVPKYEADNPRVWLLPIAPELSYNAKHGLIVMTVNRNGVHVFRAADGSPVWSRPNLVQGNLQRIYPPVVTDDYLVLSDYKSCYGYLLDILTGKEVGQDTGIPRPRTCARIIGNNNLLIYRDAATELYDIAGNRMIGLNSVRSGCTTSFIPADGVMTAPMLGHGCVCNYPMFASLGLYHCPAIEPYRPASVTNSWGNQAKALLAESEQAGAGPGVPDPFATLPPAKIDLGKFRLINSTLEAAGPGMLLSTKDDKAGYAIRQSAEPLEKAAFTFSVKRATAKGRHGNAFFVCGPSDKPDDWIECRLYYGGRSSMMITGSRVEPIEEKVPLARSGVYTVTVSVDCKANTVTFKTAGGEVNAKIIRPVEAITHYGCGGSNSDNLFTEIVVH